MELSAICCVCGTTAPHKTYNVKEMMFGTRDTFIYFECSACGSLQISEPPSTDELSKYYPSHYYSYQVQPADTARRYLDRLKGFLERQRDRHGLGLSNIGGAFIASIRKGGSIMPILKAAGLNPSQRVLDVGCGAKASLLKRLAAAGFDKLLGIDPFISHDLETDAGFKVRKLNLYEISDTFDVLIFNHSFEHIPRPIEVLADARKRLRKGGVCIIRIPTPSSDAWEQYRSDWVQLDAPRHIFLPSRAGMSTLAERCGFFVKETIDDSTAFQFSGSQQYRRDIPLIDQRAERLFRQNELRSFAEKAEALNARHRGDQAAFILVGV